MKLTPIFVAMLPAVAVFASQAATYQIVELGPIDQFKSGFSAAVNNNNQVVGTFSGLFNYPVDLTAIDYASPFIIANLTAAEIEEAKKGNVSATVLAVLTSYLQAGATVYSVQRFAETFPARLDTKQLVKVRETAAVQTNNEYLVDINDNNQMLGYGTAPFTKQSFTPAATETVPNPAVQSLWVPSPMYLAGVVISENGKVTLPALYTDVGGGYSVGRAINNNGKIIGYGSVGMDDAIFDAILAACDGKVEPVALCHYGNGILGRYRSGGLVWQLDNSGKPGVPTVLGYLGEKNTGLPHTNTSYPAVTYSSTPYGLNDRGLVVGSSVYSDSTDIRYNTNTFRDEVYAAGHATIFDGTEVKSFIDPKEWLISAAVAVNNKDIITGYATKLINSAPRSRMFIYNYLSKSLTFPSDLFPSASTSPKAINNNNMVVGMTEAYTSGTTTRRNVGFVFDATTNKFNDLNVLVSCNSPYAIVDALDINDKNVIVATAVKLVDKRNSKGEIVLDSSGNVVKENIAVAVQLNPIANGNIDDCSATADTGYERQGGSLSFGWFSLLLLMGFRRR